MVQTNLSQPLVDQATLVECIEACFDCAQACTACADACLNEGDVGMMARCVRLDLDCADVCDATGEDPLPSDGHRAPGGPRHAWGLRRSVQAVRGECENHGQHGMQHCQACAEACRRESACNGVLSGLAA